ncbi:unknown [Clostridium sp. CAG:354]|nr:unknown [Clostridium sp. CAG:354]HIT24017.1 hypothetical protein [Candidatus Faecimonas intestinavium]
MASEEEKYIKRCKNLIKAEYSDWIGIANQKAIEYLINKNKKLEKYLKQTESILDKVTDRLEEDIKTSINKDDLLIDVGKYEEAKKILKLINENKENEK